MRASRLRPPGPDAPPKPAGAALSAQSLQPLAGGTRVWQTDTGYDLDQYLFYSDVAQTDGFLDFEIHVDDAVTPDTYALVMSTWDVDETSNNPEGPEVDHVYFNGRFLGTLGGANDEWSINVFYLDPSWIAGGDVGSPGVNQVQIDIDVLTRYDWAIEVDWGAIVAGESWGQHVEFGECATWSDFGHDADQDQLFDHLVVQVPVTVETGNATGSFEWNAALTTTSSQVIGWATGSGYLAEGSNTIELQFEGEEHLDDDGLLAH